MSKHTFLRLIRVLCRAILKVIARVDLIGNIDYPVGGYILTGNHLGRLDAFLPIILADRDDIVLIMAEKYKEYAIWRYFAAKVDAIWINRFDADFAALRELLKRLKGGAVAAIAPEGTRSPTEALLPGRQGAAYVASKSGLPVIPVSITGSEDRVVKYRLKRLRRLDIVIRVGAPYTLPPMPRDGRDEFLQAQTDRIMCEIALLLPQQYRGVYADHPLLHQLIAERGSPFPEDRALLSNQNQPPINAGLPAD
jgi:1-acyl-sn-glycerol-3-phosphate acyltransferase